MKRSPEEIKAWREKMKALSTKVKAMPEDERQRLACEYGTLTAEGHTLSAKNAILLAMQAGRPLAQVGGFNQWLKVGRQVIKGQHSIGSMYVPTRGKKTEDDETDTRQRFVLVSVWDITQTEEATNGSQ